jgi:hypothetical protein
MPPNLAGITCTICAREELAQKLRCILKDEKLSDLKADPRSESCREAPAGNRVQFGGCLLQIAHVVDSDNVFGRILYWLVPCDVGFAQYVYLSIEWFALSDGLDRLSLWIQNGSNGSRAIVLFHVGGDANILIAVFYEDRGRALGLLFHLINQFEIVIHLS